MRQPSFQFLVNHCPSVHEESPSNFTRIEDEILFLGLKYFRKRSMHGVATMESGRLVVASGLDYGIGSHSVPDWINLRVHHGLGGLIRERRIGFHQYGTSAGLWEAVGLFRKIFFYSSKLQGHKSRRFIWYELLEL